MYRLIVKIGSKGETIRPGDKVIFKHFATLEEATATMKQDLAEGIVVFGLEPCDGENFAQRVQSFFNRF